MKTNLIYYSKLLIIFALSFFSCSNDTLLEDPMLESGNKVKSSTFINRYDNIDIAPVDILATETTKEIYSYLQNSFGKYTIAGDPNFNVQGFIPKIIAYDLTFYTQGCKDAGGRIEDGIPFRIQWLNNKRIDGTLQNFLTLHWHWYSPKDTPNFYYKSADYPNGTTFDVSKAVQPGTEEYSLIIRDIDAIAVQLKKLADADIPVLFRPLHEAGGADGKKIWFWWGAKGPEVCKKLWNILFDRLHYHHKLHNLIWIWSSPVDGWYPGNDKVDILGYDSYPAKYNYTSQKQVFDKLFTMGGKKKMVALTENGAIPDINQCFTDDAPWLYYMTWYGFLQSDNSVEHVKEVFSHEKVLTSITINLECEDGVLGGGAYKEYVAAGVSGSSAVTLGNGGNIKMSVNIPKSATYRFYVRYFGWKSQTKYNYIKVADILPKTKFEFIGTNKLETKQISDIYLPAGPVEIEFSSYWGWTYFDKIILKEVIL